MVVDISFVPARIKSTVIISGIPMINQKYNKDTDSFAAHFLVFKCPYPKINKINAIR